MDAVIPVRDGVRRYLFACLDLRSRFGLAVATPGMSSRRAGDFADLAFDLFPGPVDRVLSGNGSEYEGWFADLLRARGIARYYTYPKTPKMNAHAERFNRTVQEEFLDYHEDLLWTRRTWPRSTGSWRSGCSRTTGSVRTRPWASRPRSPPSPESARCSTTTPDRRRLEPQNRRHPLPTARPVGFHRQ